MCVFARRVTIHRYVPPAANGVILSALRNAAKGAALMLAAVAAMTPCGIPRPPPAANIYVRMIGIARVKSNPKERKNRTVFKFIQQYTQKRDMIQSAALFLLTINIIFLLYEQRADTAISHKHK
jgi:hypothetical protein